jgi:cytochrome P450
MEARIGAAIGIRDYLLDVIKARQVAPTDDFASFVVTSEIEGKRVTTEEALGICYLMLVAGLDTVAAILGFGFKHLAQDQDNQRLLREEPGLIPNAIEEILRAHAPVVTARFATRDVQFHGVTIKAGECVSLCTALSGLDASEFPEPHKIDFRRENLRHMTFSVGPHRCIGSHLARRELKIALEMWLAQFPPFRVKPGKTPFAHATGVFGVDYLPLVW